MMKAKIMISQPMRGRSNEEIKKERECLIKLIKDAGGEYIDTVFDNVEDGTPLYYLSKSINKLDKADIIWFMPGWEKARGCRIEFECAKEYGKTIRCYTKEDMKDIQEMHDATKNIKIKVKSCFDKSINEDEIDENIKKFAKDLEEMLNDITKE